MAFSEEDKHSLREIVTSAISTSMEQFLEVIRKRVDARFEFFLARFEHIEPSLRALQIRVDGLEQRVLALEQK
jgi:hypothetical protein